jgi:hypothetical protein
VALPNPNNDYTDLADLGVGGTPSDDSDTGDTGAANDASDADATSDVSAAASNNIDADVVNDPSAASDPEADSEPVQPASNSTAVINTSSPSRAKTGKTVSGQAHDGRRLQSTNEASLSAAMQTMAVYGMTGSLRAPFHLGPPGVDTTRSIDGTVTFAAGDDGGVSLGVTARTTTIGALAYSAAGGESGYGEDILMLLGALKDVSLKEPSVRLSASTEALTVNAHAVVYVPPGTCGAFPPAVCQLVEAAANSLTLKVDGRLERTRDFTTTMAVGFAAFNLSDTLSVSDVDGIGPSLEITMSKAGLIAKTELGLVLPLKVSVQPLCTMPNETRATGCNTPLAPAKDIYFGGTLSVSASQAVGEIRGTFTMQGAIWHEAFGISVLHLQDVSLAAGFNLPTLAPQSMELGGKFCVGSQRVCASKLSSAQGLTAPNVSRIYD